VGKLLIEPKLIIFDMDGTLIDSGLAIANAVNFVRAHYGLEPQEKDQMLRAMNDPHINSAQYFYNVDAFTDEHSILFKKYYDENCIKEMELYGGIVELLALCKESNFQMSVATNASSYYAHKMLEYVDVKHYFDLIVGADMVKQAKPSSDMILYTLDTLQIKKQNSLLVGDSIKDIMAAKSAGIDSLLVDWGFSDHDDAIKDIETLKNMIMRKL